MSTSFRGPLAKEKYQMFMSGDFGVFYTDNKSPVFYLNTSFDINDIDKLTAVRDVLDISEIDFEELVQRDLDDFRIRRDISNYLTDGIGYKFFPPIVVAVTQPEVDNKSIKKFYPKVSTRIFTDGNDKKFELEFTDSFCLRWFLDENENIHTLPTEIRWKESNTNLMAVDGQHRLVALQAIRGLIKDEKLKKFYEKVSLNKAKLDYLKVPVTILLFPNAVESISSIEIGKLQTQFSNINWELEERREIKEILRSIFVDVNKSAKQPSNSRTILLNEKDLTAVFTRRVFSSIKDYQPNIYTAILEYNSPNKKEVQIESNRSVITTIGIINRICEFLFKDSEEPDEGNTFRVRLGIDELPEFPTSSEFRKEDVKSTDFSIEQRKMSVSLFEDKWLKPLTETYTRLIPYLKMIELVNIEFEKFQKKSKPENFNAIIDTAYKTLFGGSEERFVLESLSKSSPGSDSDTSMKMLKKIEKDIRAELSEYNMFFTLMFQLGYFEALADIVRIGLADSDHYIEEEKVNYFIDHINLFIDEHLSESFFNRKSHLFSVIFATTRPEYSKYVKNLLVLVVLNYKKDENKLLEGQVLEESFIEQQNKKNLEEISQKITSNLEKQYNNLLENKVKLSEIDKLKKEGENTSSKLAEDIYRGERSEYVTQNLNKTIEELKILLEVSQ